MRDGGYCNNWEFGFENIKRIVKGLVTSGIEIIECGFLTDRTIHHDDITKFSTIEEIKDILPNRRGKSSFVCMINYGEYDVKNLRGNDGTGVNGIRMAFHKDNIRGALKLSKIIKDKGYQVFLQPMVSLNYTDSEFLELIKNVNELQPTAFYIVDSFGVMKLRDLTRLFYLIEHNLDISISIGFHSHNNMQLAYSNAQFLAETKSKHEILVDSSIYGMGRGAGNLNTELFVEFLNDNIGKNYSLQPLLNIIDEVLDSFHERNYWGYTLPNYLSAKHNAHPNYAEYLNSKKTLTIENMDDIFQMMDQKHKVSYDCDYIETIYRKYMDSGVSNEVHYNELISNIKGKEVIVVAPGMTSKKQSSRILKKLEEEGVVSVSVNHVYPYGETNYIFVSNLRRFREIKEGFYHKCIVTTNISSTDTYVRIPYADLVFSNMDAYVRDNAGLMCIRLMKKMGASKIWIAGMDGYSGNKEGNYADEKMDSFLKRAEMEGKNIGISEVLSEMGKEVEIEFLTSQVNISIRSN